MAKIGLQPIAFDYTLPEELIAQKGAEPRDAAKLLVVDRRRQTIEEAIFADLPCYLQERDVLVMNETKVFPARLMGRKETGGKIELLLLEPMRMGCWKTLTKPGVKRGQRLVLEQGLAAIVTQANNEEGEAEVQFETGEGEMEMLMEEYGQTPLPPYIHSKQSEQQRRKRYQTVYASHKGSAAAPTAGLHFTKRLLNNLEVKGVTMVKLTLHVGLGTFQPLQQNHFQTSHLHEERYYISKAAAETINNAISDKRRIVAVGTTSTRALESAFNEKTGKVRAGWERTGLFIKPPYKYKVVQALITNFHLPQSSLLALISAFTTTPQTEEKFATFKKSFMGRVYREAIEKHYRFFSFGDAMLII